MGVKRIDQRSVARIRKVKPVIFKKDFPRQVEKSNTVQEVTICGEKNKGGLEKRGRATYQEILQEGKRLLPNSQKGVGLAIKAVISTKS